MTKHQILINVFSDIHYNLYDWMYVNNKLSNIIRRNENDTDVLVHAMNAASPIKEKLPIWIEFMKYVTKVFLSKYDATYSLLLMGAAHEEKLYYTNEKN